MRALGRGRRRGALRQGGARRQRPRHRRGPPAAGRDRAAALLPGDHRDRPQASPAYGDAIAAFYAAAAAAVAAHLAAGRTVAVLSEGDPLFYGSYMHLHVRLAPRYPAEVIPGVTAMSGCWCQAGLPLAQGDDVLTVLPGTLPEAELARAARRQRGERHHEGRPQPAARSAGRWRPPASSAARSMSSAAPWRATLTMPLADKADDRRALLLAGAGAGLGGAAVSGRLARGRPRPRRRRRS